ncbi:MAG TPA: hypothetical protein VF548_08385 [Allosphingosinicella sp.]|jgi:hypothetical protein
MKTLVSTIAIACMLLPSTATAQDQRAAPKKQNLEAIRISDTPEFIAAADRNDVATMRKLLRGTGAVVQDPDPSLKPLCLPSPPKQLVWVYGNYNNVMMWHWNCITIRRSYTHTEKE